MRILVIERHRKFNDDLVDFLYNNGHHVENAYDGLTGLNLAVTMQFDAIVVGTKAPKMDGYQICHSLRQYSKSQLSIIMIGDFESLPERLTGFEMGVDDFITMPCAFSEVLARTQAVVSRRTRRGNRVLRVEDLSFEVTREQILLRLNLTCLKLLELFMRRSPAVVSRNELRKAVWGRDAHRGDSLRSNIHLLRTILDRDFDSPLLHTVHGRGYKLAAVE